MVPIIIGERLKLLIEETGLQQQKIADILGMSISTFNGYVTSKREPPVEKLNEFARYFNVSVDYLTGNSDIRNTNLVHLPDELNNFVRNPENKLYLELARDIKERTLNTLDNPLTENQATRKKGVKHLNKHM